MGLIFFVLFINDFFFLIDNGEIYMYVDDIIVFVVGVLVDEVIVKLNIVLKEFYKWCLCNKFIFYLKKSEFMLLGRGIFVGLVVFVFVGDL